VLLLVFGAALLAIIICTSARAAIEWLKLPHGAAFAVSLLLIFGIRYLPCDASMHRSEAGPI